MYCHMEEKKSLYNQYYVAIKLSVNLHFINTKARFYCYLAPDECSFCTLEILG